VASPARHPGCSAAVSDPSSIDTIDTTARERWFTIVLIALPALLALVAAWQRRWIADDGFINVRIVSQIFDGNGPVFNAGERVEAGTSPVWLLLLVVGRVAFFWMETEWVAVLLGITATVLALVVAQLAAARLYGTSRIMPLGVLVVIALPPSWDYATSGLESGVSVLWLACVQVTLVTAARSRSNNRAIVAAAVLGLGPFVRPDFVVMSVVFAVALVVATRPHALREVFGLGVAALVVPGVYELFRAAYYGALVPNTAFAKEATASSWQQGLAYLGDFIGPYELWFPLSVIGIVIAIVCARASSAQRLLIAAPVLAGLLHAFFVVRGGGDSMHARLLLPAFFAILLPIAAVPRQRLYVIPVLLVLLWGVIPLRAAGPPYSGIGPDMIANERTVFQDPKHHPITLDDYRSEVAAGALIEIGDRASRMAEANEHDLLITAFGRSRFPVVPLKESADHRAVVNAYAIGMLSVAAGTDVYVADMFGLADPMGARLEIVGRRGRPNHEKLLPLAWVVARFADPTAAVPSWVATPQEIEAARTALECPEVRGLFTRASGGFSIRRLAANVQAAITKYTVRISAEPERAAASCR
jgi:arabinofuranosyltransferase